MAKRDDTALNLNELKERNCKNSKGKKDMTKSIILNNSLVTIFGNFGELNSFIITIAYVRQIIRGLHVVTIFDMKGNKYCFECGGTTRFEHQELNNAYDALEEEMKNL